MFQRLSLIINYLAIGLTIPVFSLILMEKGANLSQLSLVMLIHTLVVLFFEIPSGIISDTIGKKKTFMLSVFLNMLVSIGLIFSSSLGFLIVVIILNGLSKAFTSGSLDALIINDFIHQHGNATLTKLTSELNIIQTLSIAVGTLGGGYVASKAYLGFDVLLIAKVFLFILLLFIVFFGVNEDFEKFNNKTFNIEEFKFFITKSPRVIAILIATVAVGFMMVSIEVYYQVHFVNIIPSPSYLGFIGALGFTGFGLCSLATFLGGRLLAKYKIDLNKVYAVMGMFMGVVCIVLYTNSLARFSFSFVLWYIILGVFNVAEGALFNQSVPNHLRATMLSVLSFAVQLGVLIGNSAGYFVVTNFGIQGLWICSGSFALIIFAIILKVLLHHKNELVT